MSKDLEAFRRIAGDNPLKAWLIAERERVVKVLAEGAESVSIHRAQGQYYVYNKLIELLEKAKDLR